MRRIILATIFIAGCSESIGVEPVKNSAIECTFQFSAEPACTYSLDKSSVNVSIATKKLADDEIALNTVNVTFDGKHHVLDISPDVSMIKGDIGTISFADINFDNIPDIAVSTSFGVANQYFDYWVYDQKIKGYRSIGNYPKLNPNPADKTLSASVKQSAAAYQKLKYSWDGGKLMQRK